MPENPRIEELRRRVQADPASIAFAALAEEFRRVGRYDDAIETCRTGLQRHPAYLSARVTLGRALIEVGEYDAARAELETVLQSAPENLAAIRGLAQIQERLGHSVEMHPDLHDIVREPIRLASQPPPPAPEPVPAPEPPPPAAAAPALDAFSGFEAKPAEPEQAPVDIFAAARESGPPPPPTIAFEPATIAFESPVLPPPGPDHPHVAAALLRLERFLGAIQSARHA